MLSPKTNPKKPGAQPSDKPKAALSIVFGVMNLSPFHRHFHKLRLFGIADHRYRFVKRTQAAHVFRRQCKVKLLDSGSPEAQITGHKDRAWLTVLHANPARRFFPHQAPEFLSKISCWINGEKLRQRFFPQTQPSRTNKENVCAACVILRTKLQTLSNIRFIVRQSSIPRSGKEPRRCANRLKQTL